jgi:hypothetical protein
VEAQPQIALRRHTQRDDVGQRAYRQTEAAGIDAISDYFVGIGIIYQQDGGRNIADDLRRYLSSPEYLSPNFRLYAPISNVL